MTTPYTGGQTADPAQLRRRLVATLRGKHALERGSAVEPAFLNVPREVFVPPTAECSLEEVYADRFIVTAWRDDGGAASSSSAPSLMARMLEMLDLRSGLRVLEVGTGTGYNAALLGHIVGPAGAVVSVEIDPQLAAHADAALTQQHYPVTVIGGDGAHGAPAQAPFDRIIVTALAARVPRAWHQQLHNGGTLVVPLFFGPSAYTQMVVALKRSPTGFVSTNLTSAGFMALHGAAAQPHATTPDLRIDDPAAGAWKRRLRWDGLADLDEPARRSLLQILHGPPRHHQVQIHDPYSLALYATLTAPSLGVASLAEAGRGSAVAFVDSDRQSIAALAYPNPPAAPGVMDLLVYGTDAAHQQLLALIGSWRQWSLPRSAEVEVDYQQRPDGQPHWRLLNTTGQS